MLTSLGCSRRLGRCPVLFVLVLVVAACGSGAEEPPAEPAATTVPTAASTTTTTTTTTTTEAATTTSEAEVGYTVARFGAGAVEPLAGSEGMLGSGCTPGLGQLPDGVWFGWIESTRPARMSFDLACLEPGDPPVVTNTNPQVREVAFSLEATIHRADGATVPVDEWAPTSDPVWIYVNWGMAHEVAYPTTEIIEATESATWVEAEVTMPVNGGCCGEMYTGSAPSPSEPWPATGLPADGVYGVDMTIDRAAGDLVVVIQRFVLCADRPELCVPDYLEGDLFLDYTDQIARRVAMDDSLTVRMIGIAARPGDLPGIEGSGGAFAALLDDMEDARGTYVDPELAAGTDLSALIESLKEQGAADPSFPYGASISEIYGDQLVYRGPLGLEIVEWLGPSSGNLGPIQLEMVDGRPVLTIDAGRLAG